MRGARRRPERRTARQARSSSTSGGPVLQNVKVVTVYWGNNVQFSGTPARRPGRLLQGDHRELLLRLAHGVQHDVASPEDRPRHLRRQLRRTRLATTATLRRTPDPDGRSARSSTPASVPAPDANTLYAIHFAPGISITMSDGSASCSVFCAYHGSFTHGSKNVYYCVKPDQGGACARRLRRRSVAVQQHDVGRVARAHRSDDRCRRRPERPRLVRQHQRRNRRHLQRVAVRSALAAGRRPRRRARQLHRAERVVELEEGVHRDGSRRSSSTTSPSRRRRRRRSTSRRAAWRP